MDPQLAQWAATRDGLVVTGLARGAGITKGQLAWAVRQGELIRIARGAYATAQRWGAADARDRHLLRLRAAQALLPENTAVAESAALVWGLPLPGPIPELPRLLLPREQTSAGARGRRARALGRRGWLPPADRHPKVNGIAVTTPARTVVDCARHLDRPWTLAVADAARRVCRASTAQLEAAARRNPCAPGHPAALWAARQAITTAESPLESLARAVVVLDGHPAPRSQVWLRTARGDVRVDLLDPGGRVIIEADGRVKYTTPETLWQEKLREDALRATGREMVRFTYRDYLDPGPWLTHYRAALQRTYGVT